MISLNLALPAVALRNPVLRGEISVKGCVEEDYRHLQSWSGTGTSLAASL